MIPYNDLIKLNQPYVPVRGKADLDRVIAALQQDPASREFVRRYSVPEDSQRRRQWVQATLTARLPGDFSAELLASTDCLLQQELVSKNITDASDLSGLNVKHLDSEKISIWNGDISTLKIGAITNAANAQMLGCFQPFHACIDNVIQCAAGPQLREDCHQIMQHQGHDEATGDAKITRAYNLPADFVLHTVGPIVTDHCPSAQQVKQLASCYRACLALAAEARVRSIAFCGISTGVFGYPPEKAASVALSTVIEWLRDHPNTMDHIVFNTYGAQATTIYTTTVEDYV